MNRHTTYTRLVGVVAAATLLISSLSFLPLNLRESLMPSAAGQTAAPASRERLLNGLSFFILPRPAEADVSLLLRIHSGAAFDLAGKEGTAALLARSLFPDENTFSFVEEELGGKLEITSDADAINIRLRGRAASFEILVELLRNAFVTFSPVDAKTLDALRASHLAANSTDNSISVERNTIAFIADRAAAARLYGSYPLGRPSAGTPESLARIVRPDLMLARERFIAPNNATLVVVGAVEPQRVRLALRQYLGAWRKSDTLASASFRRPPAPKPTALLVPIPETNQAEIRFAMRAAARTEAGFPATLLLRRILETRLSLSAPPAERESNSAANRNGIDRTQVDYTAAKLAGAFVVRAATPAERAAATLANMRLALANAASPLPDEIERARSEILAAYNNTPDARAALLLDADTYGVDAADTAARVRSTSVADVQRAAKLLFDRDNIATVIVGEKTQLENQLTKNNIAFETPSTTTAEAAPTNPRVPNRGNDVPVSPLVPAAANPPAKQPAKRP